MILPAVKYVPVAAELERRVAAYEREAMRLNKHVDRRRRERKRSGPEKSRRLAAEIFEITGWVAELGLEIRLTKSNLARVRKGV